MGIDINELREAVKQDESLKTELFDILEVPKLSDDSDLTNVNDAEILKRVIAKQRDELVSKRQKSKTDMDSLKQQFDELNSKYIEKEKAEKELAEQKLKEQGKYQDLLTQKETELENLIREYEIAKKENDIFKEKELAEKELLIDKLPDEVKDTFKNASIPIIREYLKTLELSKNSPSSQDKKSAQVMPNDWDEFIKLPEEKKNLFAENYPEQYSKIMNAKYFSKE